MSATDYALWGLLLLATLISLSELLTADISRADFLGDDEIDADDDVDDYAAWAEWQRPQR